MDERIEEIKPISSIRPIRKFVFPDYRSGEGQKYQFNRYQKTKKKLHTKSSNERVKEQPNSIESGYGLNSDEVANLKNRIVFDRAMIIGD